MLPKKLTIGTRNYKVEQVKDLKNPIGQNAYGTHTFDDLTIRIDKNISEDLKPLILFHEVLHGLMVSGEIDLDYDKEEHVVRNLTHGLVKFMQDNPDYIKSLMKR